MLKIKHPLFNTFLGITWRFNQKNKDIFIDIGNNLSNLSNRLVTRQNNATH